METGSGSGSNPPKAKVVIGFDAEGVIIQNRNELQRATRDILHSQFSVGIDNWNDVDSQTRTDIWNTLKEDFEMEDCYKDVVMAMMGAQLRGYRNRIRTRELKDLSSSDILKRLNNPPADIPLTAWNKFITREATEAKISGRMQSAENRSISDDVHCLGKKSYGQLSHELTEKGIDHDRAYLYTYARTQRDGSIAPGAVQNVNRLRQHELTVDPSDRHNIENDALAKFKGPDHKGRIRGIGSRMSKLKYIGMQKVKNFMRKKTEEQTAAIRRDSDTRFDEIMSRLDRIEGGRNSISSQSSSSIPSDTPVDVMRRHSISSMDQVPSHAPACIYNIFSTVSYECIAVGSASINQLVGENVNGMRLNDHETKLLVTMVTPGKENDPLYKGFQGDASTIGEMLGKFVIWPTLLLMRKM